MSRVNTPILDELARAALEHQHKTSPSHALRLRCQLVLLKAMGRTSHDVGQVVGLCQVSVNSWTRRYREEGIAGLKTKPGRGRKPLLDVGQDEAAVRVAVQANRQRIALAKAAWEAQRASGSPAVGRDTFRAFLKALVADTNASVAG
jgi:transposase